MNIHQALKSTEAESEILLGHVLNKPKEFLFMHPDKKLTKTQEKNFIASTKRRNKNEPLAYILGYKYFYGLKFKVTSATLIPRPETEWVVEHILRNKKPSSILDVGTGSGCIAISLKKNLPKTLVTAVDVSKKALIIARANARANKTSIKFYQSDLLSDLKNTSFDIIIANLPYGWKDFSKDKSLTFEPASALYTKESGLYLYRKLLEQVSLLRVMPKQIYLEIDPRQKTALNSLIKRVIPKAKIMSHKDLSNKWRYVEIVLR